MARGSVNIALDILPGTAATVYTNGNLTATAVKYPDAASAAFTRLRRYIVTNKHGSNVVAVALSTTATSPTFAAGASGTVGAGEQFTVFPGGQLFLNVPSSLSVWLAASAGSTPIVCMAFDSDFK